MSYLVVKWLHIVSASVLVGVGFGTAFYKWMADRSGDLRVIVTVSRLVVLADWIFTAQAVVIQLLTGLWLATSAGYPITRGWIAYALGLYLAAGACWIPVVVLQYRMRDIAATAHARGEALPATYQRLRCIWFALGVPAFSAMLAIYALMVFKPTL